MLNAIYSIARLIAGAFLGFVVILWIVPKLQTSNIKGQVSLDRAKELENEFRKTLAQILGGFLVVGGLLFTWQQILVSKEKETTDRFSKAIGLLAHGKQHVKIGGIYTLRRITRDSPEEEATVIKILSAFIRSEGKTKKDQERKKLEPDLQAAIEVLGKPSTEMKRPKCDPQEKLHKLDLSNTNLSEGRLVGFDFSYARIKFVLLNEADMRYINVCLA